MEIKITIGSRIQETITLNARKSLDGNLMIFDHEDIDIVLIKNNGNGKVLSFAKTMFSDQVYEAQDRLFKYLRKKGVIAPESIQGGNIYGSMEAKLLKSANEDIDSMQVTLYSVSKFLEEEKPYFDKRRQYEDDELDYLVDPDAENSTELGEVPHEEKKGSLIPGYIRGPYGMTSFYRY